jgi:hypothetical protein
MTISQASAELSAMLHGTTLSQVENIFGVYNRSGRQLLLDIDPDETRIETQLATSVYQGVFDYPAPDDLKGDKVIDLYWQGGRNYRDRFFKTTPQNFDLTKAFYFNQFCVFRNKGVKTLRIAYNNSSRSIGINPANSLTGNGTWAASGTASNISVNNLITDNGGSVISFDITAGAGYLTNSTMTALDLSAHLNQSGIFWDIYVPTASRISSLEIRWGSDSSNYWEATGITTQFDGNALVNNYNQIYTLWQNATKIGSPDATKIKYVRLTFNASNSISGVCFAQLWSRLGFVFNIDYYSKFLFSNTAGTWIESITDNSDNINLDTDSFNVFISQCALNCVQQALGQDAGYDTNFFSQQYQEALKRYKSMYKSEIQKKQESYYNTTFKGYRPYIGYSQQP